MARATIVFYTDAVNYYTLKGRIVNYRSERIVTHKGRTDGEVMVIDHGYRIRQFSITCTLSAAEFYALDAWHDDADIFATAEYPKIDKFYIGYDGEVLKSIDDVRVYVPVIATATLGNGKWSGTITFVEFTA